MRALIAILILALALPAHAQAPKRKPAITGNPINDINNAINGGQPQGSNEGGGTSSGGGGTNIALCDANLLSNFNIANLIQQIKICTSKDAQAALDSANTAHDNVAITCLTPVVALFKAIEGTGPQTTTSTPPVGSTTPPSDTVVLIPAGPLLIFQKFREFATAGGVPACRSWVTTTIAQGAPLQ